MHMIDLANEITFFKEVSSWPDIKKYTCPYSEKMLLLIGDSRSESQCEQYIFQFLRQVNCPLSLK